MHEKWQQAVYPVLSDPWLSHRKERTQGDTAYSRRVYIPLRNHPLPSTAGAHKPGANIKGEMGLDAIIAKTRVSSPKRVYYKNCISGSQVRWTLGFCMEATQSLKSLCQR